MNRKKKARWKITAGGFHNTLVSREVSRTSSFKLGSICVMVMIMVMMVVMMVMIMVMMVIVHLY